MHERKKLGFSFSEKFNVPLMGRLAERWTITGSIFIPLLQSDLYFPNDFWVQDPLIRYGQVQSINAHRLFDLILEDFYHKIQMFSQSGTFQIS